MVSHLYCQLNIYEMNASFVGSEIKHDVKVYNEWLFWFYEKHKFKQFTLYLDRPQRFNLFSTNFSTIREVVSEIFK